MKAWLKYLETIIYYPKVFYGLARGRWYTTSWFAWCKSGLVLSISKIQIWNINPLHTRVPHNRRGSTGSATKCLLGNSQTKTNHDFVTIMKFWVFGESQNAWNIIIFFCLKYHGMTLELKLSSSNCDSCKRYGFPLGL